MENKYQLGDPWKRSSLSEIIEALGIDQVNEMHRFLRGGRILRRCQTGYSLPSGVTVVVAEVETGNGLIRTWGLARTDGGEGIDVRNTLIVRRQRIVRN